MADQNPTPVTETPEFKQALAEAAAKLRDEFKKEITAAFASVRQTTSGVAQEASQLSPADRAFVDGLAMSIAQLTDQGTGRRRVSPEVLEARRKARDRMVKLIIAARDRGEPPVYALRNKVYLDEQLVDPIYVDPATKSAKTREIEWFGVPNEAMAPANEVAKKIHDAFIESIGTVDKEHQVPELALGITANGLVVKGGAVQRRKEIGNISPEQGGNGGGLRIRDRGESGQYVEKHILGTLAPPARQAV